MITAVAGGLTVRVAVLPTAGHGPGPSGSFVVQVSVMLLPVWPGAGVKEVSALVALRKVPVPGGAVQLPDPLAVAVTVADEPAQTAYGPPALAVAVAVTVTKT